MRPKLTLATKSFNEQNRAVDYYYIDSVDCNVSKFKHAFVLRIYLRLTISTKYHNVRQVTIARGVLTDTSWRTTLTS